MSKDKIILHHMNNSRSSRVLFLYHELKAIYGDAIPELQLVVHESDTFRVDKPADLLAINPNGKVPAMKHGDIEMFEGCAICLYLLDTFDVDHKLAPNTPDFRSKLYLLSFYCAGTVDNIMASSSPYQMVYPKENVKPMDDPAIISLHKKAWIEIVGPYVSTLLGDKPWLYGSEFTALDIIVGYVLLRMQMKRSGWAELFPIIANFLEKLKERPAYALAFVN